MPPSSILRWQLLALLVIILAIVWLLAPVLAPFLVAALLAYLGDPLADRLEKLRLSRTLAVSIVFILMLLVLAGVLVLLVPLIERQVVRLIDSLPEYATWARDQAAPWLQQHLNIDLGSFNVQHLVDLLKEHMSSAGGVAAVVLANVSKSGMAVVGWLVNLVLVPVVTFYLLRDWDVIVERIGQLLPRSVEPTIKQLAKDSDTVLGAFVRGQLSVMVALGLIYGIGLWAVGINVGPLIGMIAGLVSFVPYLGFIVGLVAGLIAVLVQYHDWLHVLLVLAVFGFGQIMEGYVLTPRLVGDKIGLHPVAVIFAVLAGGQLFGFTGVLLALPVASVMMVLLRYAHQRYMNSRLYHSGEKEVAPDESQVIVTETVVRGDDD